MDAVYPLLGRIFPTKAPPVHPRRIILIQPCCIGDVVIATAALSALRRAYPQAHLTFAVGSWARRAVEHHPAMNALLDTGELANPAKHPLRFARLLRQGSYDLAVSLVRSPLMSLAVAWSGIPHRVGVDSAGRGFGYNVRVPIKPDEARHEGAIYLDVVRALGVDVADCWANVPVLPEHAESIREKRAARGVTGDYVAVNPAGGNNPGMQFDAKRWPAVNFAALADAIQTALNIQIVLVGGPNDAPILDAVQSAMKTPAIAFAGDLSFGEIAALARDARGYIGNDTGLTHLAAAAGGRAVMIFGPSDPARYAPFVPDALPLWNPVTLRPGGVSARNLSAWDWFRDGITVDDVMNRVLSFLDRA